MKKITIDQQLDNLQKDFIDLKAGQTEIKSAEMLVCAGTLCLCSRNFSCRQSAIHTRGLLN